MNDVVGAAEFVLRATRRKLKEDLRQAEQDLKNFTNQAERDANDGANRIGGGVEAVGRRIGIAIAAMTAALLAGIAIAIRFGAAAYKMADDIADSAHRIGIGTNALQEWRHVARQTGEDAQAIDGALESFGRKLSQAAAGLSRESLDTFRALGFSQEQLRSFRSTEEALDAVIDRIGELKSESDRAAIAERLGLGPLATALREGSDEIARLRDEAREMGFVMDEHLVQRAAEAQDKLDDLSKIIGIQMAEAFANLSDEVIAFTGWIADAVRGLNNFSEKWNSLRDRISNTYPGLLTSLAEGDVIGVNRAIWGSITSGRAVAMGRAHSNPAYESADDPAMVRQQMAIEDAQGRRRQSSASGRTALTPVDRSRPDRSGERAAEREARRAERVEQEVYRARARALGIYDREALTVQERFDIEQAQVQIEREAERAQLASRLTRGDITQEEFNHLSLIQTQTETLEDRVASDILARDLADERLAQERVLADLTAQLISLQSGAARSAAERRRLELELLEITQQQRRASLRRELERDPSLSDADRQTALNRLDSIDRAERAAVERQNMGPLEAWRDRSLQTADEIREAYEGVAASGLDALNNGIVDAIMHTRDLGEAFSQVARQIIADLASIAVRQGITQPLANMLFGGGKISAVSTGAKAASGGGFMGFIRNLFGGFSEGGYTGAGAKMEPAGIVHKGEYVLRAEAVRRIGLARLDALNNLPGFADGGLVGLSSLPSLIPNSPLNSGGGGMASPLRVLRVEVDKSEYFDVRVREMAAQTAAPMVAQGGMMTARAVQGEQARRSRQRFT